MIGKAVFGRIGVMEEMEMESLVRRFFRKRFPDSPVSVYGNLYGKRIGEFWICEARDGRTDSGFSFKCGFSRKEAVRKTVVWIPERYYLSSGKDLEELELLLESEGA